MAEIRDFLGGLGKNPATYVSLFSGAGIGCYGLSEAGFQCVATVEKSERRLAVQKANDKCALTTGYICGDMNDPQIQQCVVDEVQKWNVKDKNSLDVLMATPPCQGMSVCNHKKTDEQVRNSLVVSAIEMTLSLKPKIFIFENTSLFLKTLCTHPNGDLVEIGKAIEDLLGRHYHIWLQRLNLKNYGGCSSRTRTVVIGTRKDLWFSPLSITPDWQEEVTLRKLIGDMPPLTRMGQISRRDIYHSFKPYAEHMRDWICDLPEGKSAFEQKAASKRPHKFVNGIRIQNKNANGDKYKRQEWKSVAPCVHTRNDILASQNTVHPRDDRVFSIRELMRMMSIPENFKWSSNSLKELNALPLMKKREYLKNHEMNIRQCLGEAVPTNVIYNIASKIKQCLQKPEKKHITEEVSLRNIENKISSETNLAGLESLMCEVELSNESRSEHAAFYTPPVSAFKLLQLIPNFQDKKTIRILEPSAGIGRILHFLPQLLASFDDVVIDALDIDAKALSIAKTISSQLPHNKNLKINFLNGDFLDIEVQEPYDLVIGNPPFGKLSGAKISDYESLIELFGSTNIFALFMYKALEIARNVVLICPKSILNAPNMDGLRSKINAKHSVTRICDFGEKGFEGVRIETIALAIKTNRKQKAQDLIRVESLPQNLAFNKTAASIFDGGLPYWLLYRDSIFDDMLDKMKLGVFNVFRDRQISKRHFSTSGEMRVIKGKNIMPVKALLRDDDHFINDASSFAASKFVDRKDVVLVPNLTMKPRASRMPKGCIADGSVAVLYPKNGTPILNDRDVKFFSSSDFCNFYRIARNYGTRSLNIDANSVFFFGVKHAAS